MRLVFVAAVAVTVLAAAATRAQLPESARVGPIEWSADRKLTIQDFKGAVPTIARQGKTQQGALSFLRIETGYACRDEDLRGSVRAVSFRISRGGPVRTRECGNAFATRNRG